VFNLLVPEREFENNILEISSEYYQNVYNKVFIPETRRRIIINPCSRRRDIDKITSKPA